MGLGFVQPGQPVRWTRLREISEVSSDHSRQTLPGGTPGHKPEMVGTHVECSCGKWVSKPCQGAYTAVDARRDFEAHANVAVPVNVDSADFEEKRKAWGLTQEQMLEMAASVFRCLKCQREYFGSECHVHVLGARAGEFVSLERTWTIQCPKCRGELIRVKGGSDILDKGRKFFGKLIGGGERVQ